MKLSTLQLPVRVVRILDLAGVTTCEEAAKLKDYELLRFPNFGRGSLLELRDKLLEAGFAPPDATEQIRLLEKREKALRTTLYWVRYRLWRLRDCEPPNTQRREPTS